ncbi:MAG: MOSC domain-containing protein [Planctomycetota bacterium]|jgi:MOSC domain-containing protein YiiM
MARVVSISTGTERRAAKKPVSGATLLAGHGIEGDAHAGSPNRQVSILMARDLETAEVPGQPPGPGDFAENLVIDGLEFEDLLPGTKIEIGPSLLEVTEIGKSKWKEGDYSFRGLPLVAHRGIFARIIRGGFVSPGEQVSIQGKE